MPYATLRDGARIHYYDVGQGPATIMLHGFAMPAYLWIPLILPLAKKHRFILPSLRGFHRSHELSCPSGDVVGQYADDLQDLLGVLKLDHKPALAGYSMGACTSMQFNERYGFDAFRSYTQIDQGISVSNGDDWRWGLFGEQQAECKQRWETLIATLEQYDRDQPIGSLPKTARRDLWHASAWFIKSVFARPSMRSLAGLTAYEAVTRQVMPTSNWAVYLDCIRAFTYQSYDFRESLRNIKIPVHSFVGSQSTLYPPEGQKRMNHYVPQTRIVEFRSCGHGLPFEAPFKFTKELGRAIA